jgi:hypothetical protein
MILLHLGTHLIVFNCGATITMKIHLSTLIVLCMVAGAQLLPAMYFVATIERSILLEQTIPAPMFKLGNRFRIFTYPLLFLAYIGNLFIVYTILERKKRCIPAPSQNRQKCPPRIAPGKQDDHGQ